MGKRGNFALVGPKPMLVLDTLLDSTFDIFTFAQPTAAETTPPGGPTGITIPVPCSISGTEILVAGAGDASTNTFGNVSAATIVTPISITGVETWYETTDFPDTPIM